ncbi:MAG: hypothetical protein IJP90_00895, partial [Treponema sp.]|nr:hypothetical protein [Treponema sp.]
MGHTVLDNLSGGSESNKLHFIITDSSLETKGTLKVGTAKLKSSSTDSVIEITNGVKVDISSSVNNETSTGKLRVTGDGTGSLTTPGGSSVSFVTVNTDAVNFNGNTVPTPTETDTYYWTGNAGDSEWTTSGNWAPTSTGGIVPYGDYPGSKDGDTAVFDANKGANNLTLAGANWTLNIKSNATGDGRYGSIRAAITGVGENASTATINTEGTWLLGQFDIGTLNINGAVTDTIRIYQDLKVKNLNVGKGEVYANNSSVTVQENLAITSDGKIDSYNMLSVGGEVSNDGSLDGGAGTFAFNGGYSGSGTTTLSSGSITFGTGTTNTVENLTVSGAGTIKSLSENAVELVNVTLPTASGINVIFTGDFKSTGSFTAAADKTFFVNGNVDFSGCPSFTPTTNGAFLFYNTGSSVKTLKTISDMSLRNLFFGGNVEIVLNGSVTVSAQCQMSAVDTSYNQSGDFTAKLSGGELKADGDAGSFVIQNMGASLGTLELAPSAKITCADTFYQETGTKLIIDAK